ncbi:hypothetical protein DY000_02006684 [Brassica cretica]|uniref:Uncharacterized protein n=1 Tax=Brassica cretica TaxID=69181 RepID=A0ABQ7C163_BRACR|nr:hypothetical protein DY000_02006684 [Brassica cretica]
MSFGGSHWCRSTPHLELRSTYTSPNRSTGNPEHRSTTPTESTASINAVKILTHKEFAAKHPHPRSPVNMPKIYVARLNALRPRPKPSEYPPETVWTPSNDGEDPMEEDRVPTGRTLKRKNEKVAKHLKRGANEKEKENFRKRVFRIPLTCHYGAEYETEYSASIETHTATSVNSGHQKSTDIPHDESVDSRPDDWENDY